MRRCRTVRFVRWTTFLGCCAAGAFAACGGGSPGVVPSLPVGATTSPPALSSPTVTYTAVPQATLAPFDVSATAEAVPVPASTGADAQPVDLPLPSTASVINEIDLPAAGADIPPATTLDTSATNEALTDAPAPTGETRAPDALRAPAATAKKVHIETVSIKFSKTVSLKTRPTFVFTFASGILTTANYYLQYYDTSKPQLGWQDPFEGPATIVGNTLLFADTKNAFTFTGGVKYYFDLYAVSVRSTPTPFPATPTPVASGGPSPTPLPSPIFGLLSVTPTSFGFTEAGQIETLIASEDGYSGAFSAKVDDPSLATIAALGGGQFAVTAGTTAGASGVTVSDDHGQTVRVPFTITLTYGTISARKRAPL